ncbi:hypothetical protein [Devosia sp. A369]
MNKIAAIGIASALAIVSANSVLAQQPPAQSVEAPATPPGASANKGGEIVENYGTVVDAIGQLGAGEKIAALPTGELTIILLSSLEGDVNHDGAEVDAAIADHQAAISALQAEIADDEALVAKLQESGLSAENAIAIGQNADGTWRLYVDDREQ